MSYYHYEVTDFLEDHYFKTWVYTPTRESEDFWKDFLIRYPSKSETVTHARLILLRVQTEMEQDFPDDMKVAGMLDEINSRKDRQEGRQVKRLLLRLGASLSAAAAVIIMIGWLRQPDRHDKHVSYDELVSAAESPLQEQTNTTSAPILLTLPDQSTIRLQPNSSVSYRKDFAQHMLREVYLSGEAFFEVTRNPTRPFVVYSNELVTKVLGTSFLIRAFEDARQVEVVVKTGKVSVFPRTDTEVCDDIKKPELAGTIITPNQKVLFSREQSQIRKLLVETPEVLVSAVMPVPMLKFQDVPVTALFSNIEQTYGIDIVYDDRLLGECLLTASFTNENLYEKMDLICKGIEATFEVLDGRMVVSGRGCN
nr:FecR family protein [uncultured Dyadobacter sp.]